MTSFSEWECRLLLYASIALTNPGSLIPPLAVLLTRYSGRGRESRQNWVRQVGGTLRLRGVPKMRVCHAWGSSQRKSYLLD